MENNKFVFDFSDIAVLSAAEHKELLKTEKEYELQKQELEVAQAGLVAANEANRMLAALVRRGNETNQLWENKFLDLSKQKIGLVEQVGRYAVELAKANARIAELESREVVVTVGVEFK